MENDAAKAHARQPAALDESFPWQRRKCTTFLSKEGNVCGGGRSPLPRSGTKEGGHVSRVGWLEDV